jgi:hypothetical protein
MADENSHGNTLAPNHPAPAFGNPRSREFAAQTRTELRAFIYRTSSSGQGSQPGRCLQAARNRPVAIPCPGHT